MQVDGEGDFTAIWVFTPKDDGKVDFKVYKEFELSAAADNANAFTLTAPPGGYDAPVDTSPGVVKTNED